MPTTPPEFEKFRDDVIKYLAKLEIEVQALQLALKRAGAASDDQMTMCRVEIGDKSHQVADAIRREFGFSPRH
jgi:hypothetical protein